MNWLQRLWGRAKSRVQWIIERLPDPETVLAKAQALRVAKDRFMVGMAEQIRDVGNSLAAIEPEHLDLFSGALDLVDLVQSVAGRDQGSDKLASVRAKLAASKLAVKMADDAFDATWHAIAGAIDTYIANRRATGSWPAA